MTPATLACCCATGSTTPSPRPATTPTAPCWTAPSHRDLRSCFDETAAAMGVRVLAADRITGLVLTAEPDSPLAVADTHRWLRIGGTADRMIYGLGMGGVAAWCYPNAQAVPVPGTRRVTAVDADRLIREHAAAIAAEETEFDGGLGSRQARVRPAQAGRRNPPTAISSGTAP